jgi:hypothetical protein
MQSGDRRLNLIGTGASMKHCLVDHRQGFGDQRSIPERAILLFQENEGAVLVETSGFSRVRKQHQGEQAHQFRFGGKQAEQESRETNALVAQLAPIAVGARIRVALVEDQIDHGRYRSEPFDTFHRPGRFEGNVRLRDARLRPRDALLHGALAHQKRPRDVSHRES